MPDPRSSDDVARMVAHWAEVRFGNSAITLAEPPTPVGDGYDTFIHLVRFAGDSLPSEWTAPLVVRIQPSPERLGHAHREATIQDFLCDAGYPAPRVHAVIEPDETPLGLPVQVMERVPGVSGLAVIEAHPTHALRLMARLGALHARLHALPTADWPTSVEATPLAERRLHIAQWVIDGTRLPAAELDRIGLALERVKPLAAELDDIQSAICHGDFHPLNVMVDGETTHVIDWTDACLGDPVGDVARLLDVLHLAAQGAPSTVQRLVVKAARPLISRTYLRAYELATGHRVDRARLRRWEPVHVLHDWVRVALTVQEQADGPRRVRPELVEWLRQRFDRTVGAATT